MAVFFFTDRCVKIIVQKVCSGRLSDRIDDSKLGPYVDASQCTPYITAELNINETKKRDSFLVGDEQFYGPCPKNSRKRRATQGNSEKQS